jgi:hypothetical protein
MASEYIERLLQTCGPVENFGRPAWTYYKPKMLARRERQSGKRIGNAKSKHQTSKCMKLFENIVHIILIYLSWYYLYATLHPESRKLVVTRM